MTPVGRSRDQLLRVYRQMRTIREFEITALSLAQSHEIPGVIHSSAGQEAVAIGVTSALRQDDCVTSTHRGHGHALGKGVQPGKLMAELMGREAGVCRGRGGTMHIFDLSVGFFGTTGIVGGALPLAVGAALALSMQETDRVVVAFLGDGAANTGAFHEALNLAALWRLPVVFICENNLYAESTRFSDAFPVQTLLPRAASYGIPGTVIDGNDVLACRDAAEHAVNDARAGRGPTFLQADTYRWHGHFSGDTDSYRPREEVERALLDDPIARFETVLHGDADIAIDVLRNIDDEVRSGIEQAVEFARSSPVPDAGKLTT